MSEYPETVIEVLDDQMQFPADVIVAVQRFAASGPWRGSRAERKKKFRQLLLELSAAYGITPPALSFERLDGGHSGASHYDRRSHRIVLTGKLSTVTCLHEFAHARGMGEKDACRWSINLFRRIWPEQFARLVHIGHVLIRPTDVMGLCG